MSEIEKNVIDLINRASNSIGQFEGEMFNNDMYNDCIDLKLESPIERMFYVAFKTMAKANCLEHETGRHCQIMPQFKIDKYRVDFLCSQINWDKHETIRQAVVECDGHEFHDRDEKHRRYEKQRDRYLQAKGYKIFHFTGSEINEKPFTCASEVLSYISDSPMLEICTALINYGIEEE